jgi:hypothetical protein
MANQQAICQVNTSLHAAGYWPDDPGSVYMLVVRASNSDVWSEASTPFETFAAVAAATWQQVQH